MANQPKTDVVAFRCPRKKELVALAEARGVTLTELMNEWVDTRLGADDT